MTDEQAKSLGMAICDSLDIKVEKKTGLIPTSFGKKTVTGLGYMLNNIINKNK